MQQKNLTSLKNNKNEQIDEISITRIKKKKFGKEYSEIQRPGCENNNFGGWGRVVSRQKESEQLTFGRLSPDGQIQTFYKV